MLPSLMIIAGAALIIGAIYLPAKSTETVRAERVGLAEVSDLIERLRPLAKEPDIDAGVGSTSRLPALMSASN